ncbi:MAG: alpha/beta fold hydrolase [Glycocaulis sp.]
MAKSVKVSFRGSQGAMLDARLELPAGPPRAFALFAHCFSCSKDNLAAARVSRALAMRGIAVLRFDFTGLGASEGDFANTNFSSNVEDLIRAADFLRERYEAPALLVGHSLGGAAVIVAAAKIPEVKAVACIAAPADAANVTKQFADDVDTIARDGEAMVRLEGRPFTIRRQFLDDIADAKIETAARDLKAALLVAHSPADATVDIANATRLFVAARHPKSFVGLEGADHLLSRREDAEHIARIVAAWAERYLPEGHLPAPPEAMPEKNSAVVSETGAGTFLSWASAGRARFLVDEPEDVGGLDAGPSPFELLSVALAACTTMTLRMYARHKKMELGRITARVTHAKEDGADVFSRAISVEGGVSGELQDKLVEIANKCPVHRTLERGAHIHTAYGAGSSDA